MIKYKDIQDNIVEVEGRLFVTLDKNGKDVFAGDEIKAVISDVSSALLVGRIVPNEHPLSCWMFKYRFCDYLDKPPKDYLDKQPKEYLVPAPDLHDIERIGDEEND